MVVIDFLTCGGCQAEFPLSSIVIFMEHKQSDCSLPSTGTSMAEYNFANYNCYTCPKKFGAAVSLLQHAQYQHKQKIFRDTTNTNIKNTHKPPSQEVYTNENISRQTNQQHDSDADVEKETNHIPENGDSSEITEPLSKCCTSVVPKKRKRHFETKHRTSFFKAARLRRQQQQVIPSSSDIYINVDPMSIGNDVYNTSPNSTSENSHETILQPGNTVTIPISDSGLLGNYFGISYTDSSHRSHDYKYPSMPTGTSVPPSASNDKASSVPNNLDNGGGAVTMKKKYPTSKPFKCEYCEDSFNQRIHLKKHLSKHTGVKPFKCGQCDYATVERSHLKVHIRIHTGEKPFKCDHCEYSTAQNSTLKIHLKRHHDSVSSVSLECTHCGKLFPEKTHLLCHKQLHSQTAEVTGDQKPTEN